MLVTSGARDVVRRAVAEGGVPGVVLLVADADGTEFAAAGVAELASDRPRRREDRFRIGSVTKAFVSVVALQLVGEGALGLDDPVQRWLPGLVHGNGHDGGRITLRHLLSQTSGVFNYSLDPELVRLYTTQEYLARRFDEYTPEQLVHIAMGHPAPFAPGEGWQYSNTNFVLAGMIVERAGGRALGEQIAARITGPLGLAGTYLPDRETGIRGPHARHYTRFAETGAQPHDVTELSASTAWAAGGMVSTLDDVHTFLRALLGGALLPAEQQRALRDTVPTDGWLPGARYGLGVLTVPLPSGVEVCGSDGSINGSCTVAVGIGDGERIVVCNLNGDWADGPWNHPMGVFRDVLIAEFG